MSWQIYLDDDVRIYSEDDDEGEAGVGEEAVHRVQDSQDLPLLHTVQPIHYLEYSLLNSWDYYHLPLLHTVQPIHYLEYSLLNSWNY